MICTLMIVSGYKSWSEWDHRKTHCTGPTQTGWIDEDLEKNVIPLIPLGELIQPEDIAETILFLASEQARMITGQVIKVSGGHAL